MKSQTIDKVLFILCVVFAFLSSASVMFMPMVSDVRVTNMVPLYINASVFWGMLILSIASIVILNARRKSSMKRSQRKQEKFMPGIIKFFSNIPAVIFEIIFAVCIIILALCIAFFDINEYYIFALIASVLFSFNMHCVFNGKNYFYVMSKAENIISKES